MRFSRKQVLSALLVIAGANAQGWTATLALNAFSNIVGGANAIASSCPKSPVGSCAVGAIQTVVGSILAIAAGANAFFGFWKRDADGVPTFFLTTNATMEGTTRVDRDFMKSLAAYGPTRMQLQLHGEDTVRHGSYHFDHVTGHHKVYSRYDGQPVNLGWHYGKRQEETIDGDDGFVGDFVDFNIDDWEQTDSSADAASNYANEIESQLEDNNADSACVTFDHGSDLDSELWIQPASDSTFTSVATQCGNPSKKAKVRQLDSVHVDIFIQPDCSGGVANTQTTFTNGNCDQIAGWLGASVQEGGVECQAFLTLDCTGQPLTPVMSGSSSGTNFWGSTAGQCAGFEAHPGSYNCIAA